MNEKELFDRNLEIRLAEYKKANEQILHLSSLMASASDERTIKSLKRSLLYQKRLLDYNHNFVKFMRLPANDTDKAYRHKVKANFTKQLTETMPDNMPVFFHGVGNIGVVKSIIESGKICSREELENPNENLKSEIFVASKKNLYEAVEIADSPDLFMPYGAIFAIKPLAHEIEKLSDTAEIRIDSVDLSERLLNIITTPENVKDIKSWCEEKNIDSSVVTTHPQYITMVASKASDMTKSL